jgi:signal transduction histidine kinase
MRPDRSCWRSNAGSTENGTVTLRAARQTGPGGDQIVFEVTDTGIGMSPDQIDRLFVEFSQADGSTTHRFGGTGLGLAISQRLCHAMGGSITVASREGVGASFTVTVPARLPQQVLALASSTAPDDTCHTSPSATAECG